MAALLRADPPAAALRWVEQTLGGASVVETVSMRGGASASMHRFIHRDFYPGNLLWRRRRLTGVVDWESASVGPPAIDIAHCRLNFFYATPELADLLLIAWEQATGQSFDRWTDIAAIIGVLDGLREQPPNASARHELEDALARAVSANNP